MNTQFFPLKCNCCKNYFKPRKTKYVIIYQFCKSSFIIYLSNSKIKEFTLTDKSTHVTFHIEPKSTINLDELETKDNSLTFSSHNEDIVFEINIPENFHSITYYYNTINQNIQNFHKNKIFM